jgi:hypothetical protein
MRIRLFAPGKQRNYPHIFGEDKLLVDDFWNTCKIKFNSVAYDVPVGGFFDYKPTGMEAINRDWEYLASFKIDMVGFTNDKTFIIEFKHVSKPEGIGQLLVYKHLFEEYKALVKNLNLIFVSYDMKPVIKEVAEKHGIQPMSIVRQQPFEFW